MKIDFQPMFDDVQLPVYATSGSSGFDLVAYHILKYYSSTNYMSNEYEQVATGPIIQKFLGDIIEITPNSRILLGCGYKLAIPRGYELQIRARSGLALTKGLIPANGVGTIDSDYRGEIAVMLLNTSAFKVYIKLGDRIAQGIIAPIQQIQFNVVVELESTYRGEGGYGSTGLSALNAPTNKQLFEDNLKYNSKLYGDKEDFPREDTSGRFSEDSSLW